MSYTRVYTYNVQYMYQDGLVFRAFYFTRLCTWYIRFQNTPFEFLSGYISIIELQKEKTRHKKV